MLDHDYKEDAISLLLPQFNDSVNLKGFIKSLLEPLDEFQDGVNQILTGYNIDTAVGEQLNKLGKTLNVDRLARDDEEYRKAIKIQILVNRATGSCANFIELLELVLPPSVTFKVVEQFPAAVRVIIYGAQDIITKEVVDLILPIGVEAIFFSNPYEGKTLWVPRSLTDVVPTPEAILPDVDDISTSDIVLADVFYVN